MTTADESAAFLAAICADPADDTVRLVYADWLEEHGEAARAEFIRDSIEIARADSGDIDIYVPPDGATVECRHDVRARSGRIDVWADVVPEFRSRRVVVQLGGMPRGNEVERWARVADFVPTIYLGGGGRLSFAVTGGPAARLREVMRRSVLFGINECFRVRTLMGGGFDVFPSPARGFVHQVTCPAASWLAHGDALHWHPTQTVGCPETLFGAAAIVHQAVACATCGGKGTVPRPCPPTAQPITHVDLTTRPTVAALVDLVRSRGLLDPEGVVMRHGAKDVLQMCFPGIAFTVPDPF